MMVPVAMIPNGTVSASTNSTARRSARACGSASSGQRQASRRARCMITEKVIARRGEHRLNERRFRVRVRFAVEAILRRQPSLEPCIFGGYCRMCAEIVTEGETVAPQGAFERNQVQVVGAIRLRAGL